MTARGIRNNNPGNIRHGDQWQGLAKEQPDKDFCTFESMAYGCRALLLLLKTYVTKHNLRTVKGIIYRWAPPNENDSEAYVKAVVGDTGIGPDEVLEVLPAQYLDVAKAIAKHENGPDWRLITPSDWNRGYEMAFSERPKNLPEVKPVAPFIAAALPVLAETLPSLIRIIGDGKQSDKNAKVAEKVAPIILAATNSQNIQEATEKIKQDPAMRAAADEAIKVNYYDLASDPQSVQEARSFAKDMMAGSDWRAIGYSALIGVLALVVVVGGGFLLWSMWNHPSTTAEQRGMMVGSVLTLIGMPLAFFFGSSASSRQKDQALIDRK